MTGRTENGSTPFSLPVAPATDTHDGTSLTATPPSTWETDMNLVPEQMARRHLESRQREAELWRLRRAARAVRRAEAAERRARLAREAAVLAVRESAVLAVN
jgi:uncharacterized protein (DUF885 family)